MVQTKTETQEYKTLFSQGKFEIRFYPPANYATIKMSGKYHQNRKAGFQMLAGYIFGGNNENKKLAMTSPVHMMNEENGSSMSFVMPRSASFDELPKPKNDDIFLHQTKPVYKASLQFRGFANRHKIAQKKEMLIQALKKLNIRHSNHFEFLGYNPPYKMLNRRNEVQVELPDFNEEMLKQVKKSGKSVLAFIYAVHSAPDKVRNKPSGN